MKKVFALLLAVVVISSSAALCTSASSLPSWYVADEDSFVPFHGENLPHVVDDGDAFTAEQEAALAEKAAELIVKYDYDILIFTDSDSHGVKNIEYSNNYYRFNGYGIGDDFSGVFFFINTEKGNAKWWYEGKGACADMLTEAKTNTIDAAVQPYMADGDMYGGVDTFLDKINVVLSGKSLMPYWYPETVENPFPDFHGANLPRVVDNAEMFTDEEEAELASMISAIIEKYNYDLVLFTDVSTYGLDDGVYPADFYQFNGYGIGDEYSGSVIFICMEPGNRFWWSAARGESRKYFTEDAVNAIDDRIEPYMVDGEYFQAMKVYFNTLDYIYENGGLPLDPGDYAAAFILSFIVAALIGAIVSAREKAKMKSVKLAAYAAGYAVKNSLVLRDKKITFLYKNVTRTYIPPSSSSGGGGSSYSGGYHSSGGGSFSGGGRHF